MESWFKTLLQQNPESGREFNSLCRNHKFIHEVKFMIRFAVANLILRLKETDVNVVIADEVMKLAVHHIAVYQDGKRKSKSAQFVEEAVLQELLKDSVLHEAIQSTDEELTFLRKMSSHLMPHLLPPKYLNCSHARTLIREILSSLILFPVINATSDPMFLNKLLANSISDQNECPVGELSEKCVEMLSDYSVPYLYLKRDSNLASDEKVEQMMFGISLKQVAEDAQLLFLFMQFLKEEGAVNLIQFYLAFESLTLKLMNPDLNESAIEDLFSEIRMLYKSFIDPDSIDFIQFFDERVTNDVKQIITEWEKGEDCVSRLRTCESLFSASYEVNSILEKYYVDRFFETPFYLKMVAGPRAKGKEVTSPSLAAPDIIPRKFHNKHRRQASMTSLKKSVKDSFWSSAEEGMIPPSATFSSFSRAKSSSLCGIDKFDRGVDLLDSIGYNRSVSDLFDGFSENSHNHRAFKSMSDWNISIREIGTRLDPSLKYFHVFVINVTDKSNSGSQNDDRVREQHDNTWRVERRYQEFYALESKLKEFHGEALLSYPGFYPLPNRNWSFLSTPKQTIHFLHSKKEEFGKFLSSLVTCEQLNGSRLVYSFLNDPVEFMPSSLSDSLNIKKFMKNVPAKLTSERGQNLEPFLSSIVKKALEADLQEDDEVEEPADLTMSAKEGNYAKISFHHDVDSSEETGCADVGYDRATFGAFDCLTFLMVRVFGFSPSSFIVNTLVVLDTIIRSSLDSLLTIAVSKLLDAITDSNLLIILLKRGKSVLVEVEDRDDQTLKLEKRLNEKEALNRIRCCLKDLLQPMSLPDEKVDEAAFLFYSVIQHKTLNKQFIYSLVSALVSKMFPQTVFND